MRVRQFINSVFSSNSFIIYDEVGNAFVIDPGDFQTLKEFIQENNLHLNGVLLTHVHYDHFYGLPRLMCEFPDVNIYTSENGKESLNNPKWNFSRYHDDPITIDSEKIKVLRDGDRLKFGDKEFLIISTPGHDHSCITFKISDNLFTGDSFIPGIKVVDTFPKSDKILAGEWYQKLREMSSQFNIYPGHGEIHLK